MCIHGWWFEGGKLLLCGVQPGGQRFMQVLEVFGQSKHLFQYVQSVPWSGADSLPATVKLSHLVLDSFLLLGVQAPHQRFSGVLGRFDTGTSILQHRHQKLEQKKSQQNIMWMLKCIVISKNMSKFILTKKTFNIIYPKNLDLNFFRNPLYL